MSNLSELLPAGAGAKSAEFVASGTLGSGVTVALKSDGTVEAVAAVDELLGSSTQVYTGNFAYPVAVYDTVNNKVVCVFSGASNRPYAVVGTVSGTSISFGTPVVAVFVTGYYLAAAFDQNTGKILLCYADYDNSQYGKAVVGTVSGTSISFGSVSTFNSAATSYISAIYDSSAQKVVIGYKDGTTNGRLIAATISGTSVSFGSESTFNSASSQHISLSYDASQNKTLIFYQDQGNSRYPTCRVATLSGTSFTYGSETVLASRATDSHGSAYTTNGKHFLVYRNDGSPNNLSSVVIATVSGDTVSFGTEVATTNRFSSLPYVPVVYDSVADKVVIFSRDQDNSYYSTYLVASISGTAITLGSPVVVQSVTSYEQAAGYDPDEGKSVLFWPTSSRNIPVGAVLRAPSTNSADFIGITDQAIADTATGAVIVQGGVITNSELIPVAAVSFGTASSPASQGMFNTRMAYDSTSNKIVLAYEDQSNSNYGTAVIGTISGTTISWGTPVVFNSASTADGSIDVVYDPNQNKSVIVYRDIGNSGYGTAIVGTVSGTTISFGSEAIFSTRSSYYINATYDAAEDKVLIVFADGTAPSYAYTGYMVVGTVSGSSISFGSEVQFESSTISGTALALQYDASASKSLIVYAVSSANYAASITISGTTPSIGTKNNWASTSARNTEAVYIASISKCVFAYSTTATDSPSFSAVATIDSGTGNVTVAASSSIVSATAQNERGLAYDIGASSLVYVYNATNNYMSVVLGSISGDSVTWGETTVLDSSGYANANFPATVYNSTEEKTVIAYRNATDSQSVVTNITANTPLTIGSDYYVQDDGSLSTTVSSVPAGRALSTTSILLEG